MPGLPKVLGRQPSRRDLQGAPMKFICINGARFYLEPSFLDDELIMGIGGWSEQCENCGADIVENGSVKGKQRYSIQCSCGREYQVMEENA